MNKYYAVRVGKKRGIYTSWMDCLKNIRGYKNAEFKQFNNEQDALTYLEYSDKNISSNGFERKVHIYTDGSCINNGKVNVSAGIGIYFSKNDPRNLSAKFLNKPSNQRAELYAIIKAIELLTPKEIEIGVIVHTDSMYSINCITKWYDGWRKNNWRTYKKKPVKNLSLIQRLHQLVYKYNIQLKHVYSHTNRKDVHSKGNSYADKLALRGALS
tara:strand:- start:751 stop:1389 length:639 start_codon:yes stop_codon:yes gene_type:complete